MAGVYNERQWLVAGEVFTSHHDDETVMDGEPELYGVLRGGGWLDQ